MLNNIAEILVGFPQNAHVSKICRPRREDQACRYLSMSPDGWICLKYSTYRKYIDEKVKTSEMIAKGNNCEGLIRLILNNQRKLMNKDIIWTDSASDYHRQGWFKKIEIINGGMHVSAFWKKKGYENLVFYVSDLSIKVSPDNLIFDVANDAQEAGKLYGEIAICLK